jgi:hypothetical protein
MSTLLEEIARALAETNELLRTIEAMQNGPRKEDWKRWAQKLKGDLFKTLVKESNRHEC